MRSEAVRKGFRLRRRFGWQSRGAWVPTGDGNGQRVPFGAYALPALRTRGRSRRPLLDGGLWQCRMYRRRLRSYYGRRQVYGAHCHRALSEPWFGQKGTRCRSDYSPTHVLSRKNNFLSLITFLKHIVKKNEERQRTTEPLGMPMQREGGTKSQNEIPPLNESVKDDQENHDRFCHRHHSWVPPFRTLELPYQSLLAK